MFCYAIFNNCFLGIVVFFFSLTYIYTIRTSRKWRISFARGADRAPEGLDVPCRKNLWTHRPAMDPLRKHPSGRFYSRPRFNLQWWVFIISYASIIFTSKTCFFLDGCFFFFFLIFKRAMFWEVINEKKRKMRNSKLILYIYFVETPLVHLHV